VSIREVAKELYRLERKVEELEERLKNLPFQERGETEDQLRRTRAERDRLRKILDAKKEAPPYRKPR
jgi:septal ring factor EnvC (AmiA/AmiB activator)